MAGGDASQVLLKINACSTAMVAAIAMSFAMAPPASAHHSTGGAGNHDAPHSSTTQPDHISSGPSTDDKVKKADGQNAGPDLLDAPGHDKCKRPKGARRLLPWCEDPAGGWMGSTTHRV